MVDVDIGNFVKKIILEKVFSYRFQFLFGLFLGVNKIGVDVGLSMSKKLMVMEY